jgi:hypothetical protein
LKLNYDEPLSNFAFKFNMRPYTMAALGAAGAACRAHAARQALLIRIAASGRAAHTSLMLATSSSTLSTLVS